MDDLLSSHPVSHAPKSAANRKPALTKPMTDRASVAHPIEPAIARPYTMRYTNGRHRALIPLLCLVRSGRERSPV